MNNVSDNAIRSFAAGYEITNGIINNTAGFFNSIVEFADTAVTTVTSGAEETKSVTTSFFAGIKFAIDERKAATGEPVAIAHTPEQVRDEKLEAARALYARTKAAQTVAA